MIVLAQFFWDGMLFLLCGAALGYWLYFWKVRNQNRAAAAASHTHLDNARRDAEAIVRESRLAANEAALKIREQHEQSLDSRRQEVAELDQRLAA